jgi:hypothetical protein
MEKKLSGIDQIFVAKASETMAQKPKGKWKSGARDKQNIDRGVVFVLAGNKFAKPFLAGLIEKERDNTKDKKVGGIKVIGDSQSMLGVDAGVGWLLDKRVADRVVG